MMSIDDDYHGKLMYLCKFHRGSYDFVVESKSRLTKGEYYKLIEIFASYHIMNPTSMTNISDDSVPYPCQDG